MRKELLLLGLLGLLALALPTSGSNLFAGIWRLLFAPAFALAF